MEEDCMCVEERMREHEVIICLGEVDQFLFNRYWIVATDILFGGQEDICAVWRVPIYCQAITIKAPFNYIERRFKEELSL